MIILYEIIEFLQFNVNIWRCHQQTEQVVGGCSILRQLKVHKTNVLNIARIQLEEKIVAPEIPMIEHIKFGFINATKIHIQVRHAICVVGLKYMKEF